MNHKKVYDSLIEKAKNRHLDEYCEQHHIIPRCMGGTDDKCNLVNLTAREHFLAHYLLAKMHGGDNWKPLLYWKEQNSRLYEIARKEVKKFMSSKDPWNKGLTGGKWSDARREAQKHVVHKGLSKETKAKMRKPKTAEHAEKIRLAKLNQSEETKVKNSFKQKLRTTSAQTKEKQRLSALGRKHSAETRDRMRKAQLLRYNPSLKGELHV